MRRFCIAVVVSAIIAWSSIYLYAIYKTNAFIERFSSEKLQLSYNKLYVKVGFKHPLTIIIKGMIAKARDIACNTNLHLYPTFSGLLIKLYLKGQHKNDKFILPFLLTTKYSKNNNFYLEKFEVHNARFYVNESHILLNGGVTFHKEKLPLGCYMISITNAQKLLSSDLFTSYPTILYKMKYILTSMVKSHDKIKVDYTENGILIDGTPIENI